jgi:hypothetical protein
MTTTTPTGRRTASTSASLAPAAAAGIALATVFTAIGTFQDADDHAWRQMIVTFGIILVAAAITFGLAARLVRRAADDPDRLARASVVMAVVAVLSLVVFWAGVPAVLAAGAVSLALAARQARDGAWSRGPIVAVVLSAVVVLLAGIAAVVG